LEEKAKEVARREAAQNAKAAEALGKLVCEDTIWRDWWLTEARLAAIQPYQSPSPPSDSLAALIHGGPSSTEYSILSSVRIETSHIH
jgi:hypothetical protein